MHVAILAVVPAVLAAIIIALVYAGTHARIRRPALRVEVESLGVDKIEIRALTLLVRLVCLSGAFYFAVLLWRVIAEG